MTPGQALAQQKTAPEETTLAEALANRLFAKDAAANDPGPLEPAGRWRILEGEGLTGVLRMSSDARAKDKRYGFFAFRLQGRGIFEGIYNVKPGGRAILGVFWPDGELNKGAATGILDLNAEGAAEEGQGRLTFTLGGAVGGLKAR